MSVELQTDANGRHVVSSGAINVRCRDEQTARWAASLALSEGRH